MVFFIKMEAEIAKLLNCSKEDKEGLHNLLEEYQLDTDSDSDQSDADNCENVVNDDVDSESYDMRKNNFDTVLETAKLSAEVVVDFGDELEKVKKFW